MASTSPRRTTVAVLAARLRHRPRASRAARPPRRTPGRQQRHAGHHAVLAGDHVGGAALAGRDGGARRHVGAGKAAEVLVEGGLDDRGGDRLGEEVQGGSVMGSCQGRAGCRASTVRLGGLDGGVRRRDVAAGAADGPEVATEPGVVALGEVGADVATAGLLAQRAATAVSTWPTCSRLVVSQESGPGAGRGVAAPRSASAAMPASADAVAARDARRAHGARAGGHRRAGPRCGAGRRAGRTRRRAPRPSCGGSSPAASRARDVVGDAVRRRPGPRAASWRPAGWRRGRRCRTPRRRRRGRRGRTGRRRSVSHAAAGVVLGGGDRQQLGGRVEPELAAARTIEGKRRSRNSAPRCRASR